MAVAFGIFAVLFALFLIIGLHELGHALAARLFNVKVKRISLGFGKPLLKHKNSKGIEYVLALLPVGGYVKLLNSRIESVPKKLYSHCFDKQKIYKRIIILISGAFINFVLGIIAFQIYFMTGYQIISPVVAQVAEGSVAAQAGIRAHQHILSVNGQETSSWRAVGMQFILNLNQEAVSIVTQSESGKLYKSHLNLTQWHYSGKENALLGGLGIEPEYGIHQVKQVPGLSFLGALSQSWQEFINTQYFILVLLKLLVTGYLPFAVLLGPIGTFAELINSFLQGFSVYIYLIGYLSIAVGFFNLFPIPGLDGGSIIYALIEKIRGKPISIAFEVLLYRLALIVFCVAMVQLVVNDLHRYGSY